MADETPARQARAFVKRKICQLSQSGNESMTKAALARLRRGVGKAPGSIPELWAQTLEGLPEALAGSGSEPSRGEWAVHTALTLYALHQQGKDIKTKCMSKEGETFGISLRGLIKTEEDELRVKRRFDAAATADGLDEFSHHLRGLVQLLKAEDIPLDYPALTEDLFWFQFPSIRDSVKLRWGRDFYRGRKQGNGQQDVGKDDTNDGNE
jgi:CRISPR system Cascade subunit CasB